MGRLIQDDARRLREYFEEMAYLLGQTVYYRFPLPDKHYTTYTEIESNYGPLIKTDAIFEEYPNQKTLRKQGWFSEGEDEWTNPIIRVSYNLPNLQQGCLFIIPSGIDGAQGRLFRVTELRTIMQYPDSVMCRLVPEYVTTVAQAQNTYIDTNYNYIQNVEGDD